jgi:CheY-like chemotaxis protein
MKVLLISNDYNYSDVLKSQVRRFDASITHNMDSYDSFDLLKNNNKFDCVLIDEDTSDYDFKSIYSIINNNDPSIPIIVLISGNARSINYFCDLMNRNIIYSVGVKAINDATFDDIGDTLLKLYAETGYRR